jgi:hypothetical protein
MPVGQVRFSDYLSLGRKRMVQPVSVEGGGGGGGGLSDEECALIEAD